MASVFSRRIIAYVIDFFVVSAVMWIISYLLSLIIGPIDIMGVYGILPYFVPILGFVYFVFLEKTRGATIGKALMYLEVRSRNGAYINWAQSIVRNLTKIYWIPIIFDWAIGRFMNSDRLFANITKTVVVNSI
ncbi:RDD family protein [uncultured Methanobrevibacter sp.]|uniref:RDD family protein n=1 Tax=uncultured Methanobrevibacter sp. TaxID=253161 RepID=UPI0025FD6C18|nr:RDD family protein [uncultured Methanobrevibacter sp.]